VAPAVGAGGDGTGVPADRAASIPYKRSPADGSGMTAPDVLVPHSVGVDRAESLAAAIRGVVDGELRLARTPAETLAGIADVEAVVTNRLTGEQLAAAERLEWVHALSAGVDHFDREALAERGVVLTNSAGVHAEPIAEQVLAFMLTFERGLHEARANQERGVWQRVEGGELRGKTLGVVGVGSIGTRVAELGSALGMRVLGTKRDLDAVPDAVDGAYPADEYHELLGPSDYLVVACPLTDETRGLLGMDEFTQMGGDGVLINVARGEICDQEQLVSALQHRVIGGAALDVFETEPLPADSPLWDLPNVLITPHMAGSTPRKPERWRALIETNYAALSAGDRDAMKNVV